MKTSILLGFVLLALVPAVGAEPSKIYKCKNEKGEVFYTQTYNPALCSGGGAELSEQGIAIRTIERVKTAEELAREKAAAEEAAKAAAARALQQESDQVLMLSYASEEAIAQARDNDLAGVMRSIQTTEYQRDTQQDTLTALLGEAAEFERAGQPVPETLAQKLALVRTQLETQNAIIERKRKETAAIRAQYDLKLKRFKELKKMRTNK